MIPELNISIPAWLAPTIEASGYLFDQTEFDKAANDNNRQPLRYLAIFGGRGSGKSHAVAELIITLCTLRKVDVVCLREVQKSLNMSVKRLLESKIEKLGVGHLFEVQDKVIKCPHGGIIVFQGMQNHTAESVKSLEGFDLAWFEEAQACSQVSLELLRPTIRKPGSVIIFTWNPSKETDPVDVFFRNAPGSLPVGTVLIEVNWADNPWFPEVLRLEKDYDQRRDPDAYAHVWLGQYVKNSEARVFKNWTVEEFEAPGDVTHRLGADWGFASDPTVLVRCHTIGRKLYVDYEAYRVGCEIVDTPALFLGVPEAEKWPCIADSARPETISHMQRHGFPKIVPAIKGPKSVEEGVEWLKSFDIIVHPRCKHTIDELMLYSFKTDKITGEILPILEDKHNHVIDALRYACEGVRRAHGNTIEPALPPAPTPPAFGVGGNMWTG